MAKFKPTILSSEFINAINDAQTSNNGISFTTSSGSQSVASSAVLTDDQANTNNFKSAKSFSQDLNGTVSSFKNIDTNTSTLSVTINNLSLSNDVKVSTIFIYGSYNGKDILVATARLDTPDLMPAYDGTPVTMEYQLYIAINGLSNTPIQLNEAGLATNVALQNLDSNVVHKKGDEIIYDTKTFDKPIKGTADITVHYLWDSFDIDTLKTVGVYSGYNVKIGSSTSTENFSLIVEASDGRYSVKQTKVSYDKNKTFVRYFNNGVWTAFTQIASDESILSHNIGDEKIDGIKTYLKKIQGSITNADVADVRTNSISDNQDISKITTSGYYAGRNVNNVQGIPSDNFNGKYFDLTVWLNGSNGFMFIVDDSDHMYFRKRQNSVWLDYKPMPIDDNKLTHLSKDEKVTGSWSFDKEILGTVTLSKRPVMFDLADGTDLNSIRISGSYSCGSNRVGNSPVNNWFSLVVVQNGQFNGTQTLTDTNSGDVYTRVWNTSGNWFSQWEKLSSDSKVVHNSGNETIYDKKTFDAVTTFNNGIVNKPISMNGFKIDVSQLVSGTYNVWQNDISGCPADFGVVEVFENVSNTMYRFTQTNLQDGPHIWVQIKNSFGFSGWKKQM